MLSSPVGAQIHSELRGLGKLPPCLEHRRIRLRGGLWALPKKLISLGTKLGCTPKKESRVLLKSCQGHPAPIKTKRNPSGLRPRACYDEERKRHPASDFEGRPAPIFHRRDVNPAGYLKFATEQTNMRGSSPTG